ncbi:hypothetical protein QBC46DRAFT_338982 [Diplogelasinospora grovesii]|uniref:NADH dehydrogenase [ubiquinone] 1 beta subcomplex subunit 4 n=1 Tax=Diplogelasinospora grovesii TaxID=303347 RepID=A0AAN6S7U2_9PEZI|nr:hypothetical protein QBC46DRAFT_338982 [Diplogelasinospora grovesii]
MAGLPHNKMAMDPALVRLGNMSAQRYKYFRWTPRTAWISFMFLGVVPACVGYVAYTTDGKWDLRAKRRGDVISEF